MKIKSDRAQTLHRIILPLVWLVLALLSWHWPGDKGLSFYFASIVGAWVHELVPHLTGRAFLIGQCVGGLPVMFGVGWLLDRWKVSPVIYTVHAPFAVWVVLISFKRLPDTLMMLSWGNYAVGVTGLIIIAAIKAQ